MKKKKGFTLIEVMIVIAIISILASITIDAIQYDSSKNKINKPIVNSIEIPKIITPIQEQCVHGYTIIGDKQLMDDKGYGVRCY